MKNFKRMKTESLQQLAQDGQAASAELVRRSKSSSLQRLPGGRVKTSQGIWFPAAQTPEKRGIYRTSDCPNLGWAYSRWTGREWVTYENWGDMHRRGGFYWQDAEYGT